MCQKQWHLFVFNNQLDFISSFTLPQSFSKFLFPESTRDHARDLRPYTTLRFPEDPTHHQDPQLPLRCPLFQARWALPLPCPHLEPKVTAEPMGPCLGSHVLVHNFQPQPWDSDFSPTSCPSLWKSLVNPEERDLPSGRSMRKALPCHVRDVGSASDGGTKISQAGEQLRPRLQLPVSHSWKVHAPR